MSRRYTYTTELTWGGDEPTAEHEVTVSYTVAWGAPEQGPTYWHGGLPADPDEVDDIRLEAVDGKLRPCGMGYGFIKDDEFADMVAEQFYGSERLMAGLLTNAAEEAAADYDEAMEYRAEQRREDAMLERGQ